MEDHQTVKNCASFWFSCQFIKKKSSSEILQIFYPLEGEPLSPQTLQELIENKKQFDKIVKQFKPVLSTSF
jgi:hypothetical protein